MKEKGLLIVYTGNGKGKTTAALGLALRQVGHGGKVLFVQFLKQKLPGGEYVAVQSLPGLEIRPFGRKGFIFQKPLPEDYVLADQGIKLAKEALEAGSHTMIVLDELHLAIQLGLIDLSGALEVLAGRGETHVVTTGRDVPEEIIQMADIVSEVTELKHDYHLGRQAKPGIEY